MDDTLNDLAFLGLKAVQIGITLYAIWAVWRWEHMVHAGSGHMLLPVLVVLLLLSLVSFGRSHAQGDLLWWAYTIYDLVVPLTVIKLVGAGWCWPFCPRPKNGAGKGA